MKISKEEYEVIIRKVFNQILTELDTEINKEKYNYLLEQIENLLIENINSSPKEIFDIITEDYFGSIQSISKLSPGLETGIKDIKYGITVNTISGKKSDIPNDELIDEETVFDSSSITKLFTAILLLKDMEEGNIDLNKTYSDYSPLLEKMNVPINQALRFGFNIKTDDLVAKPGLSKEERLKLLLSAHQVPGKAYDYNDIQYMLVPFLYGNTTEEATQNYLKKFYNLYRGIGLNQTGYSTINMTGGNVVLENSNNSTFDYRGLEIFDPKAHCSETEIGLVPAHAGVTTTIKDLEKLFIKLNEGLISDNSLKQLITTAYPESIYLQDEEGNYILNNNEKILLKHAMGVYPHIGNIEMCNIAEGLSKKAFAVIGSTGTYFVFDIQNGISYGFLSNIRSGLYSKIIDIDYNYGVTGNEVTYGKTTLHLGHASLHKGSMEDGKLERGDGKPNMSYVTATSNFKIKQLETLLKLRIAKKVIQIKNKLENKDINHIIEEAFNNSNYKIIDKKDTKKVVKQKKL